MEKKRLQTLLEKYWKSIKLTTLTTDRHKEYREYPKILHQFDVWHFGMSVKKTLSEIAKKKRDCQQVTLWIKAIIIHLWWCCASSIGNEELIRENWLSMLNHIWGIALGNINYFTNGNTDNRTKNVNGSQPIHQHF